MGDILHALPAVTALRQAHPSWQIGWVVEPRWQALLRAGSEGESEQGSGEKRGSSMPVVDRLHFAASRAWKRHPLSGKTLSQIKELRRELRAAGYNAVLDLQGAIRSAVIGRMTGCVRRIGEARPREWPAQWFFTERIATHGAHVIEQDVELASAVAGDPLTAADPLLPVDPGPRAGAAIGSRSAWLQPVGGRWRSSLPEQVGAQSAGRPSATRLSQKA